MELMSKVHSGELHQYCMKVDKLSSLQWGRQKTDTEGWCEIGSEHQKSYIHLEFLRRRKKDNLNQFFSGTMLLMKRFQMNLVWIGLRVIWGDHVDGHRQVEAVHQGDVKVILRIASLSTTWSTGISKSKFLPDYWHSGWIQQVSQEAPRPLVPMIRINNHVM